MTSLPFEGQSYVHVHNLDEDYVPGMSREHELVDSVSEANCVISRVAGTKSGHKPLLDLDIPAALLPSSTEGHSHLYIDHEMSWKQYKRLLKALASAGIIESNYAAVSIERKYTSLRLPWIKKEQVND